jgi:hypothetical protein
MDCPKIEKRGTMVLTCPIGGFHNMKIAFHNTKIAFHNKGGWGARMI